MTNSFRKLYSRIALHPNDGFETLRNNKRQLPYAWFAVGITAFVYTLVYLFLIFGGGRPFNPWLPIDEEVYYKYNVFFCAPSMIAGWALAAGTAYFLTRKSPNPVSYRELVAPLGFGISIASWSTGIHDLITSFLGAVHIIDQRSYESALNSPTIWRILLWIQMVLYLVLFVLYFVKAVRANTKMKPVPSFFTGLASFLTYQLFFLIFNR